MAIQLYGLTLRSAAERLRNTPLEVAGTRARLLPCDDLYAIVSDVPAAEPQRGDARPTLDDVRRHDDVLQAAVATGATVAAARFGQRFADDAACCADVRAKSARVRRLLEQYDGYVEMRLLRRARETPPPPAAPANTPGRAYLERVRGDEARLASHGVKDALGSLVRAEVVSQLPHAAIAIAHLVRDSDVAAYRAAVAQHPELSDACVVGPLPLYSFTDT